MIMKDIINNYIENLIANEKFYSETGTVKSVDKAKKICSVELLEGILIEDIKLETDLSISSDNQVVNSDVSGFVLIPRVNSKVICTFTNNTDAFISMFSEVSDIYLKSDLTTFNDGDNGGLINIVDQVTKLNGLVNELTQELVKIATGITGVGGAYTPGTLSQFNKSDFEDTKIKH